MVVLELLLYHGRKSFGVTVVDELQSTQAVSGGTKTSMHWIHLLYPTVLCLVQCLVKLIKVQFDGAIERSQWVHKCQGSCIHAFCAVITEPSFWKTKVVANNTLK